MMTSHGVHIDNMTRYIYFPVIDTRMNHGHPMDSNQIVFTFSSFNVCLLISLPPKCELIFPVNKTAVQLNFYDDRSWPYKGRLELQIILGNRIVEKIRFL